MRILIVSGSVPPEPCGVGAHAWRLARELCLVDQIKVGVLTSNNIPAAAKDDCVDIFPIVKDNSMSSLADAMRTLIRWRPDVVHFQFPTQGYRHWGKVLTLMPVLTWLSGCKIAFTWHEPVQMEPWSFTHALLPGGMVLVRPNYRELMGKWYKLLECTKRILYIQNGSTFDQSDLADSDRLKLRASLLHGAKRLVVYFGFAYPLKGVEQVYEIADPQRDRLIFCFQFDATDSYHRKLAMLAQAGGWATNHQFMGYMADRPVADILAVADAVVLPFRGGSGPWNTSALAARDQGTLLVTTSLDKRGYTGEENTFYAAPDDTAAMKAGLTAHIGTKRAVANDNARIWRQMAAAHLDMYGGILSSRNET